jgi:hypothetical protein
MKINNATPNTIPSLEYVTMASCPNEPGMTVLTEAVVNMNNNSSIIDDRMMLTSPEHDDDDRRCSRSSTSSINGQDGVTIPDVVSPIPQKVPTYISTTEEVVAMTGAFSPGLSPRLFLQNINRRRQQEQQQPPHHQQQPHYVTFGQIVVFEHAYEIGDNPGVSDGPPLTIGWKAQLHSVYDVSSYERYFPSEYRRKERGSLKLAMTDRVKM